MWSFLLIFLLVITHIYAQGNNQSNDRNLIASQNENSSNNGTLRGCESALARIQHSSDRHVFTGCQLNEMADLDSTLKLILDFSDCDDVLGVSNTTSFVQNYTLETTNARKSVKGCVASQADVVLLISTVVRNRDASLTAYFERKQVAKESIPSEYHEATFKVLPRINVKLPADFFYPFSCRGPQTGIGSTLLFALFIPLSRLLL
uniref:ZP domain-containing protein n=1 Tax=Panagrellus redivivus TaxID=6233 RepID=A0A7E4VYH0_PANRE